MGSRQQLLLTGIIGEKCLHKAHWGRAVKQIQVGEERLGKER